jgi:hypothetical protein
MELFLDAWLDPDRHEVTRHVARRLIVAHHRGTTIEAKIMLVHAALEYLAWVTYVLSGKCSGKKYREARPSDPLRGRVARRAPRTRTWAEAAAGLGRSGVGGARPTR